MTNAYRPLILNNGQIQQLPINATLDAPSSSVDVVTLANGESSAIAIGTPVYISGAGACMLAAAAAAGTADVIGLVRDPSIAAGVIGVIQTDSLLVATTAQWDSRTGDTGGLTPGSPYFLSVTPGRITRTPPTTTGQYLTRIGRAISTTALEINLVAAIGL